MCPNSFVLLRKVLVKEGHWQPVGRCCLCLGVWQSQWQILCLVPSPDPCPGLLQMNSSQKLPHSAPPGQRSPVPTWELGILGSPASASLPAASLAARLGSGQIQATPVRMQREDRRLLALS